MDDTIKTSDTDFKGYNPYIPYTEISDDTQQYRYTLTMNDDGLWNMEKTSESNKEYPYNLTDKCGNEWTIHQNEDESLRVEQSSETTTTKNHLWKYNENKILKEVEDYVTSTYGSHYCGSNEDYKDIQTIDLMAAKDLAANFCQANILKYGSRYGQKNGRNKRDLMKVIHYAMLLLHFDGHYSRQNNGLSEFR